MSIRTKEIVKVQQSLRTTAEAPRCLIYNESRSVMGEIPLPPAIAKALGKRPKAYFEATVDEEGMVYLGKEVGGQPW